MIISRGEAKVNKIINHILRANILTITFSKMLYLFHSRGRGGGVVVTSYIWHNTDVRAEWPPFSALPGI